MSQFLTQTELAQALGLVKHLNEHFKSGDGLGVIIELVDANGECPAKIDIHEGGEYGLVFP